MDIICKAALAFYKGYTKWEQRFQCSFVDILVQQVSR